MRGTSCTGRIQAGAVGLIPAGAGNMGWLLHTKTSDGAHPRGCGEHARPAKEVALASGSSPQVRGKRWVDVNFSDTYRLIPAGAGKTSSRVASPASITAHPRRCGENATRTASVTRSAGSSPQVRGKPTVEQALKIAGRLIPAGAGKTNR